MSLEGLNDELRNESMGKTPWTRHSFYNVSAQPQKAHRFPIVSWAFRLLGSRTAERIVSSSLSWELLTAHSTSDVGETLVDNHICNAMLLNEFLNSGWTAFLLVHYWCDVYQLSNQLSKRRWTTLPFSTHIVHIWICLTHHNQLIPQLPSRDD